MNKYERWTKIVRKVDHSEWDCQLKKKLLTVRVGLFSLREKAPTKKYLLVWIDIYTVWPEAKFLRKPSTEKVI